MGRIKSKLVKRTAQLLFEKSDKFSTNFDENKRIVQELGIIESKKIRNQVAGYLVRLVKKRNSSK